MASIITGRISIFVFASLLRIPIWNTDSPVGLNICAITAEIKKYKSIIPKKNTVKTVLLSKSKLISMELLISKTLIDSNISHDALALTNNVLKEYDDMKKEKQNLNN